MFSQVYLLANIPLKYWQRTRLVQELVQLNQHQLRLLE
jgi:uncharacterized protein YjiS (DUF1127 family)